MSYNTDATVYIYIYIYFYCTWIFHKAPKPELKSEIVHSTSMKQKLLFFGFYNHYIFIILVVFAEIPGLKDCRCCWGRNLAAWCLAFFWCCVWVEGWPYLDKSQLKMLVLSCSWPFWRWCSWLVDSYLFLADGLNQWLFLVPVKGGIGGIVHPPIGRKNTTYSPCLLGGQKCYRSHLLREPKATIDLLMWVFGSSMEGEELHPFAIRCSGQR